jgi:hypothetical protein
VLDILGDDPSQVRLPERNNPAQAIVPHGTYKSFRECVQIGASGGQLHSLHTCRRQDLCEALREHRISVVDQVPHVPEEPIQGVGQNPANLLSLLAVHLVRDADNVDLTGLEID